jgi:cell division protein FtsX
VSWIEPAPRRCDHDHRINAVIVKVFPFISVKQVASELSRWKHLTTLTQAQQETLLTKQVIEKSRRQQLMILVLLVIVSAVIIALIIYTLTMDKVRSIATLKFVGASDRTIIGLIVEQALLMGIVSFVIGLVLTEARVRRTQDEREHQLARIRDQGTVKSSLRPIIGGLIVVSRGR